MSAQLLNPQMIPWVVAAGAALIVLVLGFGLGGGETSDRAIEKRLNRGSTTTTTSKTRGRARRGGLRREEQVTGLEAVLRRVFPNPEKFRALLERTGKAISILEFSLAVFGTILVVSLGLSLAFALDPNICVMSGLLVGLIVPYKIIVIMGNRRNAKFMKEFPAAIEMIVRGLKSGLPFIESVNAVGREFPDPVGIEFRRVSDAVKLGQTLEQSMWDVASRIDAPEFKFLIVAMTIQRETGGNLAETLGNLADLLRKRKALFLKIRALSSEARASAYIIGALPFLMEFIINLANHDYASLLWTTERGQRWAMTGAGIMFLGYYIMYRMVNFDV